jgi:hypothetical protein
MIVMKVCVRLSGGGSSSHDERLHMHMFMNE